MSTDRYHSEMRTALNEWRDKKFSSAEARLTALIIEDERDKDALNARSCVRSAMGMKKEALEDATRLVSDFPDWYKSYARKAACEYALDNKEEALTLYEKAKSLSPPSPHIEKEIKRIEEETRRKSYSPLPTKDLPLPDVFEDAKEYALESTSWGKRWRSAVLDKCREEADSGFSEEEIPLLSLFRSHAEMKVRWTKQLFTQEERESEYRSLLRMIYSLAERVGEHKRIPFVVSDVCDCLGCPYEAYSVRVQANLHHPYSIDNTTPTAHLAYFPPMLEYVHKHLEEETNVPMTLHTVRYPMTSSNSKAIEFMPVFPHMSIYFDFDNMEGRVVSLVFFFPSRFVTKAEKNRWVGLVDVSCCMISSKADKVKELIAASDGLVKEEGGTVIYLYTSDGHFSPAAKKLREEGKDCIHVFRFTSVHLYRSGLHWKMRHCMFTGAECHSFSNEFASGSVRP